jgi:hypothetical protein
MNGDRQVRLGRRHDDHDSLAIGNTVIDSTTRNGFPACAGFLLPCHLATTERAERSVVCAAFPAGNDSAEPHHMLSSTSAVGSSAWLGDGRFEVD